MKLKPSLYLMMALLAFGACMQEPISPTIEVTVENFLVSLHENPVPGQVIGTLNASTNIGTLSYAITEQSPENAVEINATTGELLVADSTLFDFEQHPLIEGIVEVKNGAVSQSLTFTLNLIDIVNEGEVSQATVWSGTLLTFNKADESDPTQETNQDRMTDLVWITRANDGGQIFNIKSESVASKSTSPAGTAWAEGKLDDFESLSYQPFRTAVGKPQNAIGKEFVVHLIEEDIYLSLKITTWSDGKKGGFTYQRSTP